MTTIVSTRAGRLRGEVGPSGVTVFRGIPYAAAPVGEGRFRAPRPVTPWQGTRDALHFGHASVQDKGLIQDLPEQDEDCLNLNVWTPACDGARRPVMVWIHGGSFTHGSGAQQVYDGAALAQRGDVVVVTINYRLGALGFAFLCDVLGPGSDVSGNCGLHDQVAALEWVRDNIEGFGGDPENVTVFGESAGAMSVGALLTSEKARRLFRRAVAQSGATHHVTTREEATRMAELFMRGLDATPSRPERLWSASARELVVAQRLCLQQTVQRGPRGLRLPQGAMTLLPVGDGALLPDEPFDAITQGQAREIDLLVGTTLHEWNYFVFLVEPQKRDIDEAVLHKIVDKRIPGRGAQAIALYREQLGHDAPPWRIYSAIESDRMFRIPALRLAEAHSAQGGRTFMYLFDWESPLFGGEMGACHAIEIPFVFGTTDGLFGRTLAGDDPEAARLSEKVLRAWSSFARRGDPSHDGLFDVSPFDENGRATLRLGRRCQMEAAPLDAVRPFWEGIQ